MKDYNKELEMLEKEKVALIKERDDYIANGEEQEDITNINIRIQEVRNEIDKVKSLITEQNTK